MAGSLNNLAKLYLDQDEYRSALPHYERAVAIWEKAGLPNLAAVLENYASVLEALGRQDEAEEVKARAKRIRDDHARKNPKTDE